MKAAFIESTGPADVIQYAEVPEPSPGPSDVVVRMGAVSVNPIDTYIRSGNVKQQLPSRYIVGSDVAGTVAAIGSDVIDISVGDRVWASNQGLAGRQGTFSEFCCVDQKWVYATPADAADETVAALALTAITADLGLHLHGQLVAGEVVFVNGGTGGVGSAVVQIAKASGATVITTVGSDANQKIAEGLGADHVINYRNCDVAVEIKRLTQDLGGINLWFETLRNPNPEATLPLMAKRGRYVLMAGRDARPEFPIGPLYVNDLRAIGFAMFNASPDEQRVCAERLNQLISQGKLVANIGARFRLQQAAAAHQLQEDNTINQAGTLSGKIVLTP